MPARICPNLSDMLVRRARDGIDYTYEEFEAWYGDWPMTLAARWAEAAPVDISDAECFEESSLDSETSEEDEAFQHRTPEEAARSYLKFGDQCLHKALDDSSGDTSCGGKITLPKGTLEKLLQLCGHLCPAAVRHDTPERYLPLRRALDLGLPEETTRAILRAYPSAASKNGAVRRAFHQGVSIELVTDIVAQGPAFSTMLNDTA
ncbi:unnamed protein product [Polarella glacialis]|uniref:Uncharacterized protein n=1 Tax=Polarella glacialis TaxID=89957 RepID=A0A813LWX6_POLGL|nr:unnamed protein product [Polarella glacialis]